MQGHKFANYWSKSTLRKERGWSEKALSHFLGPPDLTPKNPYYRSGPPLQLYLRQRVEIAEQSPRFQAWKEASRAHRAAAMRAVQTKRKNLLEYVESLRIVVPPLEYDTLTSLACQSYNEFQLAHSLDLCTKETASPSFLRRISVNYIRHHLTTYESELERIWGRVGTEEAYLILKRRVLQAIANQYPLLATECEIQTKRAEEKSAPIIEAQAKGEPVYDSRPED